MTTSSTIIGLSILLTLAGCAGDAAGPDATTESPVSPNGYTAILLPTTALTVNDFAILCSVAEDFDRCGAPISVSLAWGQMQMANGSHIMFFQATNTVPGGLPVFSGPVVNTTNTSTLYIPGEYTYQAMYQSIAKSIGVPATASVVSATGFPNAYNAPNALTDADCAAIRALGGVQ